MSKSIWGIIGIAVAAVILAIAYRISFDEGSGSVKTDVFEITLDPKIIKEISPGEEVAAINAEELSNSTPFRFDICSGNQKDCVGLPSANTACHLVEVSTVPNGKYVSSVDSKFVKGSLLIGNEKEFSLILSPHASAKSDKAAARYIQVCGSSADESTWRQAVTVNVSYM
jgi:hypothetical protein